MSSAPGSATRIRYVLLAVATANAFLLYLDRICMTAVVFSNSFQKDLGLDKDRVGNVLMSFFFAYALGQLPAGWLADRFGPRRMLVVYILSWSLCTALTGFVSSLFALVTIRVLCGLAEAGAYPASARLIARWFPFGQRARASSVVALGGRTGNALALWLTGGAMLLLGSWRPVLWIYGACGIVLALLTGVIFRDSPESHPWANDAERQYILSDGIPPIQMARVFPWRELLRHRGLWLLSLGAFGMNFGWAFLITWLKPYLQEVHGLNEDTANRYVSIVLIFGMVGMLFGGWWCDALTRRFGPVWGRRLPFVLGCGVSALAYMICPLLGGPVAVCVACAVVACAGDSMNPAVWALCQDMGGNQVASTLAWSNMWGNFGASALAKLLPMVLSWSFHRASWSEIFWMCAGGFLLLAVCVLFVDSTQRLGANEPEKAPAS
jgi:MFS transporter, ACS family, glucarate transporter